MEPFLSSQRAIDYYHKAIRNSSANIALYHELGKLLVKLQYQDKAEAVFQKGIQMTGGSQTSEGQGNTVTT